MSLNNNTMHHFDQERTGWNPHESVLNINNVNNTNFKKLFEHNVDGDVFAQPLYIQNITIPQKGIHNVLYVATENDMVYAFDADSNIGQNANPLWARNLCLDGEVPVPNGDIPGGLCTDINPHIGITSTPAIDISNNILYVVAKSKNTSKNKYFQRIHALDITSGNEIHNSVEIKANDQGITFNPLLQFNRSGLLLNKGVLYIAFACHCDVRPYYGWIMAYDVGNPNTPSFLTQIAVKNLNPIPAHTLNPLDLGGGIWMAGFGISCDSTDNIYVSTGNGLFDAYKGGPSYCDSAVKLQLDLRNRTLNIVDYFTPSNQEHLKNNDLDLGSGGIMVIPDHDNRKLATLSSKTGIIYLLNREDMGKYGGILNKSILPETAIGTPYIASISGSDLVIAWTGTDFQQHINIANFNNATSITQKIELNESSIDGPGVAFGNGTILLGWTGTDLSNHINVVSSNSVISFNNSPNKQTLRESSHFGPAVTFGNGLFFVAWIDSNHHINIRSSSDGINFSDIDKVVLDETSNARPAISYTDGNLYLLWIGQDINNSINLSKSTDNGKTFTDKIILKDSSDHPPHLASNNGLLFLAWTGKDILRRLNEDTAEEDIGTSGIGKGNKLTFSDSSTAGPSLSKFNGNIYICWTGTDIQQHINIATLSTDRVVQRIKGVLNGGVFGGPAYFRQKNDQGQINEFIYYCGNSDNIKSFELSNDNRLSLTSQTPDPITGSGGTTPCISSNGNNKSTAILWAITRGPGKIFLRAYDATNLSHKLGEWEAGVWNKIVEFKPRGNLFNSPTIANGKVYVASQNLITAFGLD
jgi:hypothetical protein